MTHEALATLITIGFCLVGFSAVATILLKRQIEKTLRRLEGQLLPPPYPKGYTQSEPSPQTLQEEHLPPTRYP